MPVSLHSRRAVPVSLHSRPIVVAQVRAQRAQPEAEAALDSAEGDAVGAGDLGVGVVGGIGESDRRQWGGWAGPDRAHY